MKKKILFIITILSIFITFNINNSGIFNNSNSLFNNGGNGGYNNINIIAQIQLI